MSIGISHSLNLNAVTVRTSACRECQAQIFFAKTPNDKTVPLDVMPAVEGTYVLDGSDPVTVAKFDASQHAGRARYESHFKTCSNPSRFSKRKSRRR